jgi:hypothetical protein
MFRADGLLPRILAYLIMIGCVLLLDLKGTLQYTLNAIMVSSLVQIFFDIEHTFINYKIL